MTYEEAKELATIFFKSQSNQACNRREWEEAQEYEDALNLITSALENQIEAEKYKWHDLRKNPDDLPSGDDRNILTKDKLGSYHVFSSLMFCEYRVYTNIICWKEIEPFEEVEK